MTLSADTRQRKMLRDNFKCRYCGYDGGASLATFRNLCIDHLKSRRKGGTDELQNLVTACRACNSDKATNEFASIEEARRWLRLYRKECSGRFFETYVVGRKANISGRDVNQWGKPLWDHLNAGEDEPEA